MSRTGQVELRQRILAAASIRFGTTGFRGTSLQDIAGEVGCAKASLLYHFVDKDAILAELMAPAVAALTELDARLAALDDQTARQPAIEGIIEIAVRFRQEITLLYGEIPELLRQPAFGHVQQMMDRLHAALTGRSDRVPERTAALVLLTGIAGACAESEVGDEELRPILTDIARRVLDLPPN